MSNIGKKKIHTLKLIVEANNAKVNSNLGPILGQHGLKTMEFCKNFNEKTKLIQKGVFLKVILYIYKDNSYDFLIKTPPVPYLVKKIIINDLNNIYKMDVRDLYKISLIKQIDIKNTSILKIFKSILNYVRTLIVGEKKLIFIKN